MLPRSWWIIAANSSAVFVCFAGLADPIVNSARSRLGGGWVIPIGLIEVILQLRAGLLEKRDSSHRGTIVLRDKEQGVEDIADLARSFDRAVTHLASPCNLIRLDGKCFRNR
jgi:hypothetical protein